MIEKIFFDSMPAAHVELVSVQPVGNVTLLKKFLQRVATEQSSVEMTFHATTEKVVPLVLEGGLRTTHCKVGPSMGLCENQRISSNIIDS